MNLYSDGFRANFRFYVACLWTDELDFYYRFRSDRPYSIELRACKRDIMRRADRMGAFE